MKNLRSMFPGIPDPEKVFISRWGQEENILGTYSYKKVGRNFKIDSERLQMTLIDRLYFAGEATSGGWAQTTTGAWRSGEEAANSMLCTLGKTLKESALLRLAKVIREGTEIRGCRVIAARGELPQNNFDDGSTVSEKIIATQYVA